MPFTFPDSFCLWDSCPCFMVIGIGAFNLMNISKARIILKNQTTLEKCQEHDTLKTDLKS